MVAPGQHVGMREQIGLLGSSGRSTGPHVHYEVQVDGVPQDPEKFLQAGNIVQISTK
jgi:murein DD-endopeptidase MepM/ murein hydrolase activator NlpD